MIDASDRSEPAADGEAPWGPVLPEEALEPALRALIEKSGAIGGAVCLFDEGQGVLRLGAEVGLSDEGCRLLRTTRAGADGWEEPLSSLLEQRISVVHAGGSDPPFPLLVEPTGAIAAVACVPLHADGRMRGSVVLIAGAASVLSAEAIADLAPRVREVERVVDAIHERASSGVRDDGSTPFGLGTMAEGALALVAPIVERVSHVLRSTRALPGVGRIADVLEASEWPGLGLAGDSRARELEGTVKALREECRRLEDVARESVAAAETRWQARIEEARARRVQERRRVRALELDRDRLAAEVSEARGAAERARQELGAALDRHAAGREERLRRARDLMVQAEELRASAAAEAEQARQALADAEASMLSLADEVRTARTEAAQHAAAAQAARVARDRAEVVATDMRGREGAAVRSLRRVKDEVERLRGECRDLERVSTEREAAIEARWQASAAHTEREWRRDRERLEALGREHTRAAAELEEVLAREAHVRAELATVERAVEEREGAVRRAGEMARQAEEARAAAVAELEAAREELGVARSELFAIEERYAAAEQGAAAQDETLRRAVELNREREAARAAAVAELNALQGALGNAQAVILAAEEEARKALTAKERLEVAVQAALADRQRHASALDDARARLADAEARTALLGEEARTLRQECHRLEVAVRERETEVGAGWQQRLAAAERALTVERERCQEVEHALERERAEVDVARTHARRIEEELVVLSGRSAADREETLRQARGLIQAAEEARAAAAAETEAIRTVLGDAQGIILGAEEEARQVREEMERLVAEADAARAERHQLQGALEAARAGEAAAAARLATLEALEAEAEAPRAVPERAVVERPTVAGAVRRAPKPSGRAVARTVAVLDDDIAWTARADMRVDVLAPTPDLAARLADLAPGRVLANLACPGVLEALAGLRARGYGGRFWGVLARPGTADALALGMVEVATGPPDADAVFALVAGHAARGARVLVAGGDAIPLMSLRHALTRAGMSVSVAWDAKQAADLVEMVRPAVVMIDLGLPPRGAHRIVAGLGAADPLPVIVLVPSGPDEAAGFTEALGESARAPSVLSRKRLLEATLRRSEDPSARPD